MYKQYTITTKDCMKYNPSKLMYIHFDSCFFHLKENNKPILLASSHLKRAGVVSRNLKYSWWKTFLCWLVTIFPTRGRSHLKKRSTIRSSKPLRTIQFHEPKPTLRSTLWHHKKTVGNICDSLHIMIKYLVWEVSVLRRETWVGWSGRLLVSAGGTFTSRTLKSALNH